MLTDQKPTESLETHCALDAMAWIVIVLLLLGFGVLVILGAVLTTTGFPPASIGAAVAAGVFSALLAAMMLLAHIALTLIARCRADGTPSKQDRP